MTLRSVEYRDKDGRLWLRGLPDGVPDSQARTGVPLGPPSLADLHLPRDIEVRLHNELYMRRLFTPSDARKRMQDLRGALMAALRVDASTILAIYEGQGVVNAEDKA